VDARLEQAIALLSSLLGEEGLPTGRLAPWQEPPVRIPTLSGRVSATDRLSWWFRPSAEGRDPWDSYFESEPGPLAEDPAPPHHAPAHATEMSSGEPPGRRAALRLLFAEPEEEMIDADAEAVVTCLYDFVHALGRGDVATAVDECVALDYHTMEQDVEVDRDGLAAQLGAELDRLRGWEIDISLVEIPEPILHPDGILVYTEFQIEARKSEARQTLLHRRLAVFRQGRDRRWRISALSAV
jgi:ketosteroid isomerase-like protein